MTIGALAAIERHGLTIPRDIAVVGFDDFPWADVLRPRLTTIAQPLYELGRTAAEVLLEQLSGSGAQPRQVRLPGTLVIRDSSGTRQWRRIPIGASLDHEEPPTTPRTRRTRPAVRRPSRRAVR
jgi:ABC-type sugar transport system substrate-binding protein